MDENIFKPEYLGDGVYGQIARSGDIKLYTDYGDGPAQEIYLDSRLQVAVVNYIQRSRERIERVREEPRDGK